MPYNPRTGIEETFNKDTGLPGSALPPGPGYVLDPNGKIIVGNSTYYPSTTSGKLDPFSKTLSVETPTPTGRADGEPMYSVSQRKWVTSPTGAFPTAVQGPQEQTPYSVVDQQLKTLQQRFGEQFKRLQNQNLPPAQQNKILAGMQADYDTEKYKLSDIRTQLDGIQSAIDSGAVDPALGQQTQWGVAAPYMVKAFNSGEARGRFGPESVESFGKAFENAQENARLPKEQGGGFDPAALKVEYIKARKLYSYDTQMNRDQQQAFDMTWDDKLAEDPNGGKLWQDMLKSDPQLFSSRTYGSQLLGAASQKVTGKRISPFAQGVNTPATETVDRRIGTIVTKGGKQWKIVSIASDGEPLVEAVR